MSDVSCVLALVAALGLGVAGIRAALSPRRETCPKCGALCLATVDFYRANPPPCYSTHRCSACGATFVRFMGSTGLDRGLVEAPIPPERR